MNSAMRVVTLTTILGALSLMGSVSVEVPATASHLLEGPSPSPTVKPSPSPSDDEPIRIETELVNLNVRVIDRNNRPVAGLTQNDFKVFENNVPQRIEFFSTFQVPTNYALVIDNSGSLRQQLDKVIEASKVIVRTNLKDDQTSVIRFVGSDKIEVVEDFTSDTAAIFEALDNLYIEGGQTAIIDAVYLGAQSVGAHETDTPLGERKRRALIVVSDGEDRDSFYKEAQLYELLKEVDVQIFTIGFIADLSAEGGFISKSPQAKSRAFLEKLARETGGKAYFPNSVNELNGIAADIGAELRTQYSIGYMPPEDRVPGTFRPIRVTVADGPNKEKRVAVTRTGVLVEPRKK